MTTGTNPLAGRRFVDEAGNPIVTGQQLGAGGEGTVYEIDGQPGTVVKIWHSDKIPDDVDVKFRHMVNNPVTSELGANWRITWPLHLVTENGAIVGYVMPRLDYSLPWIPIISYYNPSMSQRTGRSQDRTIQIDDRVRIASNLALGFRAVHDAGYVIGDINEKNAEANRQNDVALMDCDSYGFTDAAGRTFSNNMGRAEFQAPEVQNDYSNRTQEQDRFALAVLIFQLLTGYHPYLVDNQPDYPELGDRIKAWLFAPAGRGVTAPDHYNEAWERLTDKQQELFLRCFDKQYEGQSRPTPEEWVEALLEMPAPDPAAAAPEPGQPQPGQPQPGQPQPGQPQPGQPQPAQPQPRQPQPAQPQPRQPQPRSGGGGQQQPPDPEAGYTMLAWVSALAGYGALMVLMFVTSWWWWLALLPIAALLLYFPAKRLFAAPITVTRWIMIGAASLVTLFMLVGLGEARLQAWEEWRWRQSLNTASAAGAVAPPVAGNAALAGGGAGGVVPVAAEVEPTATAAPEPLPTDAPAPTDTPMPPMATPEPVPTDAPMPTATATPLPLPTATPEPAPVVAPPPPTPAPVLTVLPAMAHPGETVAVKLTGFPPYTLVHQISIQNFEVLGDRTINTDANGDALIDDIVVPAIMDAGIYDVRASVGALSVSGGQLGVVAIPPTPTPPPYPDPVLLAQRGPPPGHLSRAPGVQQYVSGCFVGSEPRQRHWLYLADWPSATLENARNPVLLEFRNSIPGEELREVIPGECYYVGPITYQTDESVGRCPGTVYGTACSSDAMHNRGFRVYVTEGELREITETPRFGN